VGLWAVVAVALLAPVRAWAILGDIELGAAVEQGYLHFGSLARFTGYHATRGDRLDQPQQLQADLRDEAITGWRISLVLRRQLELEWSRFTAHSRYEFSVDGQPSQNDPTGVPAVQLPAVDVRLDLITLGLRPARLERFGVAPVGRLGFGWTLQSPDGPVQFPSRLPGDYSRSAKTLEATVGLEGRWSLVRAGAELRSFHWTFDPPSDFVPRQNTHDWMTSLWLGAIF